MTPNNPTNRFRHNHVGQIAQTGVVLQMILNEHHQGREDTDISLVGPVDDLSVRWIGVDKHDRQLTGRTDLRETEPWVQALWKQGWTRLRVYRGRTLIAAIDTSRDGERTWWSE